VGLEGPEPQGLGAPEASRGGHLAEILDENQSGAISGRSGLIPREDKKPVCALVTAEARWETPTEGGAMAVLVQMSVKVQDVDRFVATSKRFEPMMAEMGARNQATYQDQNDPMMVSTMSEWDSHDGMHEASEKYGDQFNAEAGTEGLEWETRIWEKR
jgi:hypothetical protein